MSKLTLQPMTAEEAKRLVTQLLGCYPSPNIHDPEVYIAQMVTLLVGYPLWAGEKTVRQVSRSSKFIPSVGEVAPVLEDHVTVHRHAAEWEAGARATIADRETLRLEGPGRQRPTYEDLKAKHGENWGITNPGHKRVPTKEESLERLRAEFGAELVDAVPDAPPRDWKPIGQAALDEPQREDA